MARFFGGLGGGKSSGSRNGSGGDKGSGITSKSSLERAMAAKNAAEARKNGGKTGGKATAEERYQALMQAKMESNKKQLMAGGRTNKSLVGGKEVNKEMSKTTQATIDLMAEKMAKSQMKKAKKKGGAVTVKPMAIGGQAGGWIDAKGKVTNAWGMQVLQIDLKTGKILTGGFFGRSIGKFDPKSTYCFYKMQKKIEEFNMKKGLGATNMWGQKAGAQPAANPAASLYGSSTDNNNGGGGLGW